VTEPKDYPSLKVRKAYLTRVPWVTILKQPHPSGCTGWHNKSFGRKQCPNRAYYSFKHHRERRHRPYGYECHKGEREFYCWSHLIHRGFYGGHCEEGRINRWMRKNPPPWATEELADGQN